ncbi:CU044_5270 family protein [Kribbella sp. NPDC051770]|uniref:CU044_5270 family protein n=1 Tax=Kribbella sp. NPDC051770 TaxID=3155413 RepID=UPI00344873A3
MDDLDKIRSAFPEPPGPTPEATAKARRELEALVRAEATPPSRANRWYAAARSGRVGIALTATAATVALAALATPVLLSPGNGSGSDAAPAPGTTSAPQLRSAASQVLLDLAVKQEQNEKVSGKYFRVRSLQLRGTTTVGRPSYQLERRSITESWMPMKQGVESWFGWVDLGARPATPADTARWKAQGSPTSWQLSYEVDPVTMAPSEPVVNKMTFDQVPPGYYLSGIKPVTAQQIQALPTDPKELRKVLASGAEPEATQAEIDYTVFNAAGRLLFEMPSPPKLRGAALRVLSMLPGAELEQGVKDPIGRTGTAFSYDWSQLGGKPGARPTTLYGGSARYVVDTTTGRLLSSESTGPKTGASVVLESGWTDERPTPPSKAIR